MTIDVHEWPPLSSDLQEKIAVFELDVQTVIYEWGNTTYSILVDFLSPPSSHEVNHKKKSLYPFHSYSGLQKFVKSQKRLQLASVNKPFAISHYRHQKIDEATKAIVCVDNGLKYYNYDWRKKR